MLLYRPLLHVTTLFNALQADVLLYGGGSALTVNKNGEGSLDLACRFGHIHVCKIVVDIIILFNFCD